MNIFPACDGLPDRDLFDDRLQVAINQARRYCRGLALLRVDIDRSGNAGVSFDQPAGVELQVEAARRLLSCVREADTVARLDDDAFALVIGEVTIATATAVERVAQRILDLLAEPCHLDAGTVCVTGSVGIALFPQHGDDSNHLLRSAAAALQMAKDSGRSHFRIHVPGARNDSAQPDLI